MDNRKLSVCLFICSILLFSTHVTCHQFQLGWNKPTGKEIESYDAWAERNRFHVGDTIYFKYDKDSVLIVGRNDYTNCTVSKPITKFEDGNTVFRFDRYGYFYFISGEPGHCKSGQKLVIRVMVHPDVAARSPSIAPAPQAAGGPNGDAGEDWGGNVPNSTMRLPVASYFMTALGGMMVILYLFM
ncbi:hypothetical protein ACHQM5_025491 [Ranunculus cassubicifolius]